MNKIDKLLGVLKQAFNLAEFPTSIKEVLIKQRDSEDCKEDFVNLFFNTFCSRGYNEFVDYELLAIRLSRLFKNIICGSIYCKDTGKHIPSEIVYHLLFDDRHDCYQNVPCFLSEFVEINQDSVNPEEFWMAVSDCLIDSFNADGAGDSRIE